MGSSVCCRNNSINGECIEDYLRVYRDEEDRLTNQIKLDGNYVSACYSGVYRNSVDRDSRVVQNNCIKIKLREILSDLNEHVNYTFLKLEGPKRQMQEKVYMKKLEIIWLRLDAIKTSKFEKEVIIN